MFIFMLWGMRYVWYMLLWWLGSYYYCNEIWSCHIFGLNLRHVHCAWYFPLITLKCPWGKVYFPIIFGGRGGGRGSRGVKCPPSPPKNFPDSWNFFLESPNCPPSKTHKRQIFFKRNEFHEPHYVLPFFHWFIT